MLTSTQLQDWDTKLQLPVMSAAFLKNHAKGALNDVAPILFDTDQQEDYPVHSLIAAYEKQWANSAELACLHLLSLFPYPVHRDVLLSTLSTLNTPTEKTLLGRRQFGGFQRALTPLLHEGRPDKAKLIDVLYKLMGANLLQIEGETISAFRPVQSHFADALKNSYFDEWRLQQQQLVYYYDDLAESAEQADLRFWLNCKKLLHSLGTTHKQQALDEVYRPQLAPLLANKEIGIAGYQLRLHLLSGFFQQPWDKTDFCLNPETKGYVQAEAGQALYQLGDQQQSVTLLGNAREMLVKAKSWLAAGEVAQLLGQHAAKQRDMPESIRCYQQSIDYAEQGKNTDILLRRMRSLFELYKNNGDIEQAGVIADKAKRLLSQKNQAKPAVV